MCQWSRWKWLRGDWLPPLLSCEKWMLAKENPDRKKTKNSNLEIRYCTISYSYIFWLPTRQRRIGGISGFQCHHKKSILDSDFWIRKIDFYSSLSVDFCVTHWYSLILTMCAWPGIQLKQKRKDKIANAPEQMYLFLPEFE